MAHTLAEAHSEAIQTSKMELFEKITALNC